VLNSKPLLTFQMIDDTPDVEDNMVSTIQKTLKNLPFRHVETRTIFYHRKWAPIPGMHSYDKTGTGLRAHSG
jgi:hypothetical protein